MQRKAFTLVELLVVIAIIALLIAILAPSLKAAKDLARATYCMTTLNALNKSALVYAEGNRGYLMVFKHDSDSQTGDITGPNDTWKSYVCFYGGDSYPTTDADRDLVTGLCKQAMGFGLVYAAGLLGPAEMFYCPDQKDVRMTLANYPKPWGTGRNEGSQFIRNGYMYNPWVRRIPGGTDTDWTYEDALMVSRHPSVQHLTSDIIESEETMSHRSANSARWNLAYSDGHVEPFENRELFLKFIAGLSVHDKWAYYNDYARPYLPGAK